MGTTVVRKSHNIPLKEVSALCVRPQGAAHELLAVGDEAFRVVVATLGDAGIEDADPKKLRRLLPKWASRGSEGSEWEGVAADGEGRVFVLRESSWTVFVLSPDLEVLLQTIELGASETSEPVVRCILEDEDIGAEALVLLASGGLLVARQREPAMLVEFGRVDETPPGVDVSFLEEAAFRLSDEPVAHLTAQRHWAVPADVTCRMKSVNDLAVDHLGRLHAISSTSRRIYRLALGGGDVRIDADWDLSDEIEMSRDRKPEGLTFDPDGCPLVAVDTQDKRACNLFVLEKLEG
jgi:hypothetical protein